MRINSKDYKTVSYEYQRENDTLVIYKEDTVIMQVKIAFDVRFTDRTLQYFGDMLYETLQNKIEFIGTACKLLIDSNMFDYDVSQMWRAWD